MEELSGEPIGTDGPGADEPGQAQQPYQATAESRDELDRAIDRLVAETGQGVLSVSRVVNPLLQLWSVARDLDPAVAQPIENLLTALVGRSLTTSGEIAATMAEVRAAAAATGSLAKV